MANTTLHSAIGIAISKIIPIPFLSIPVSFISHAFVDLYPEWYSNEKKYGIKEVSMLVIEILLAIFILVYLIHAKSLILWIGAISANFMDIWDYVYFKLKSKNFWFCHSGGSFPLKVSEWQGFGMRPLQTAVLDVIFVVIILCLSK